MPYTCTRIYCLNICFVFQGHTDEEAELWLEEIQTAIDNANKDAQFGLKCKSYMNQTLKIHKRITCGSNNQIIWFSH